MSESLKISYKILINACVNFPFDRKLPKDVECPTCGKGEEPPRPWVLLILLFYLLVHLRLFKMIKVLIITNEDAQLTI